MTTDQQQTIAALKRAALLLPLLVELGKANGVRGLVTEQMISAARTDAALLEALAKAMEEGQEITLLGGMKHGRWFAERGGLQAITSDERTVFVIPVPWSAW